MQKKLSGCSCHNPYSLIIVDLNMPRMGGIEFMKTLLEDWNKNKMLEYSHTTFILSTAQGDHEISKLMNGF